MRIGKQDIVIKGKKIQAQITIKEKGDRELLKRLTFRTIEGIIIMFTGVWLYSWTPLEKD